MSQENDGTNRRQALAGVGSVSLTALFAACGADDERGPSTTTEVTTTKGATTTVRPYRAARLADLFDDAPACTLTPQQAEGPYYLDTDLIRSDIREDRRGVPLSVAIRVRGQGSGEPLNNAVVDVWHCDAGGIYSGFEAASRGDRAAHGPTDDARYLRGAQVTNSDGIVEFKTIYPGWYRGRTVHIHTKVHLDNRELLTTQLYFDEAISAAVFRREPYSGHTGRDTFNEADSIFDERTRLKLSPEDDGYLGVISFDVASA
jgi:protocatechuate 3,4-dioxygenase beta subunit